MKITTKIDIKMTINKSIEVVPILLPNFYKILSPPAYDVKRSLARNAVLIQRYGRCGANGRTRRRNYREMNCD